MKRTIFIYGAILAALIMLLKLIEYRYFVGRMSIEFYIGTIALGFTALGIWLGKSLISRGANVSPAELNHAAIKELGLSAREMDVLEWMAKGLSNQEIADKLFVSLSTIKTHSSNLFVKLDVKRRTQAVQKAKELNLVL